MSRFKTKYQGYQMRKMVYACVCGWHTTESKVRECPTCRGVELTHFDSRVEYLRFKELQLLVAAKLITKLKHHTRFNIAVSDQRGVPQKGCYYEADFDYIDENGQHIIEDVKPKDPRAQDGVFKLKRRLFKAAYSLEITIIGR